MPKKMKHQYFQVWAKQALQNQVWAKQNQEKDILMEPEFSYQCQSKNELDIFKASTNNS